MKRLHSGLLVVVFIILAVSCKKNFEEQPLHFVTEDYIWDKGDLTADYASRYLTYIYSKLPQGYLRINGVPLEAASDDGVPTSPGNATWNVIRGGYSPSNTYDDNWNSAYSGIRETNIFLNNYKRVPFADANRLKWFPAEARALRAYFYFELIKRYGGVPLVGDKVFGSNDAELRQLKRNSFDDCVKYIVSELEAVKDSLRPEETLVNRGSGNGANNGTDGDAGRIRKSIVLSLKAKVLLLAASPLFNPSSTPALGYTGYASYSAERWQAAADAAKAVMDLNLFQLEADRYMLWRTRVNKEVIFVRMGGAGSNNLARILTPVGYNSTPTPAEGRVSPTQELVDAFPMKNGKAITDPTSGYNAANPYANRDPRLDQTVFYNTGMWLKRAVETFEGGKDKPNNPAVAPVQTLTGYYLKKLLANDNNNTAYTLTNYHPSDAAAWIVIRYADILLMYAEAKNEFSAAPDASVYSAVEAIRQRAGLVPFALPAGLTQSQMRDVIRNERRVEFAFEEQRFWDIRRWKIAKAVYGKMLHGVTITKNTNGTFTYTPSDLVTPYYTDAMNLLPIALKETQVNQGIGQNPGY